MNKVTVKRAAQLMGKSELFVREGIKAGLLPIGTATKLPGSEKWNFHISPAALAEYLGCSVAALSGEREPGGCLFTEEQIQYLTDAFGRLLRGAQA